MLSNNNKNMTQITVTNEPYHYDERFPILSIHLASNRPDQFTQFVENIHNTCTNKNAYEIIVKIDTEDEKMITCVTALVRQYGENKIKPLIGARKLGPWSTWEFYNDMFHMTHERSYFLWNPSDEVRFNTQGWDKVLEKYIGFFPDNIFRMKLSDNRLRNFYKFHEVLGVPDNFPFMTKKWMDLCGLWGDCHSPDLFHQAISFYLGLDNIFRDFPIFDIELGGIEAGLLIPASQSASRTENIRRLWQRALSKQMRSRYIAHAEKIKFFIESCKAGAKEVKITEYTGYPSKIHCSNDLGMKLDRTCFDRSFITYTLKLMTLSFLSKVKNKIRRAKSILMRRPSLSVLLVLSSLMIMKTSSASTLMSLLNVSLLIFSAWVLCSINFHEKMRVLKAGEKI